MGERERKIFDSETFNPRQSVITPKTTGVGPALEPSATLLYCTEFNAPFRNIIFTSTDSDYITFADTT
jgi:hypothetical protein